MIQARRRPGKNATLGMNFDEHTADLIRRRSNRTGLSISKLLQGILDKKKLQHLIEQESRDAGAN